MHGADQRAGAGGAGERRVGADQLFRDLKGGRPPRSAWTSGSEMNWSGWLSLDLSKDRSR
jgi:hypothetical protein